MVSAENSSSDASPRAALASTVRVRSFDGEMVVLDADSGDYFALNEVGATFVEALEQGYSVQECFHRMHALYDVAREQLWADLLQLFHELLSRRLIVLRTAGSADLEV